MMKELIEAASRIENPSITEWKKSGKPVVGYTCSFLPSEILYAAGILPVRLRGIQTESTDIGDAYFGPFICTFPKCILQLAGDGTYGFLDGTIIIPGCDGMRRLDDCWRKCGEDNDGTLPSFFFHFGVPHKAAEYSITWFVEEINRLIRAIEEHFQVKVTEDKLKTAIQEYNRGRRLLAKLESFRTKDNLKITGVEAFAASVSGTVMERVYYNELLEKVIKEIEERAPVENGRKRLMLIGSVSDDVSEIQLIEDSGAIVVAENICFGIRHESDLVDEEGDPVEAIARRYLSYSVCPRMYGGYTERLDILKQKIKAADVDGVVMQNIRFCDLHGSENGLFERDLEKENIPCMRIEREYGSSVETGRTKMRVDAFLERMAS